MSAVRKMLCLGLLQALFLSTVTAQIFQNIQGPQIKNVQAMPYSQQQPLTPSLLSSFTTSMAIGEKLGTIANLMQKMPGNPRGVNQRQYMAEALKQSALESLMVAANACKCNPKPEGMLPLPMQQMMVGGDVSGQRAVKVRYI